MAGFSFSKRFLSKIPAETLNVIPNKITNIPVYSLPTASTTEKGGVKVGTGLSIENEVLSVSLNNTLTSTSTTQALTAAQGKMLNDQAFGVGQTWQNLTASRAAETIYTNTTGKPIQVAISYNGNNAYFDIGGVEIYMPDYTAFGFAFFIIPNGTTYRIRNQVGINSWSELR